MRFISFFIAALPMMATAHPYQPYQWDTPRRLQVSGSGIGTQCSDVDANGHLEWDSTTDDGFVVPDGRFQGCDALKTFKIRDVQRIGVYAFFDCPFLESVDWTFDCRHNPCIESWAFGDCYKLAIFDEGATELPSWPYGFAQSAFKNIRLAVSNRCDNVQSIKIITDNVSLWELSPPCFTRDDFNNQHCLTYGTYGMGYEMGQTFVNQYAQDLFDAGKASVTSNTITQADVDAVLAATNALNCLGEAATLNYLEHECGGGVQGTCATLLNRCTC